MIDESTAVPASPLTVNLYRIAVRWQNDRIALAAGKVYELTDEEAAQVQVDCPGALEPLPDNAVARLRKVLDELGVGAASFRPGPPNTTSRGQGRVEVMTPANMPGLTRPKGA